MTNIESLTVEKLFTRYVVIYLLAIFLAEVMDYLTRRFHEPFVDVYTEHLVIRFFKTILGSASYRLFNYSKEKLINIVGKYTSDMREFLGRLTWNTIPNIVNLLIILVIFE